MPTNLLVLRVNQLPAAFWEQHIDTNRTNLLLSTCKRYAADYCLAENQPFVVLDDYFRQDTSSDWLTPLAAMLLDLNSNAIIYCLSPRFATDPPPNHGPLSRCTCFAFGDPFLQALKQIEMTTTRAQCA